MLDADAPAAADDAGRAVSTPPGWYGKLPTLGDFASRRLEPDFIEAWDTWLAQGLADWSAHDPDGWLARYLDGPSWRFVLMPGVLPAAVAPGPLAGVLMPSVDRVGRYFPFTIAWPLARLPADADGLHALFGFLHQLDDLALDALQDDWSVEQLETELAALAPRLPGTDFAPPGGLPPSLSPAATGGAIDWQPQGDLAGALVGAALQGLLDGWHGAALWLCDAGQGAPRLRITPGLPAGSEFSTLMTRPPATPPPP